MIEETVKKLKEFEDMINSKEWQAEIKPAKPKKKADCEQEAYETEEDSKEIKK